MGLSIAQQQRLQEIAEEVSQIVGECCHADGRPMTFAELEEECIEAGDLLTAAMLQQRVRQPTANQQKPCCPTCERAAEALAEEEVRLLEADRGEVSWLEPAYYCRHCRRSFFPSHG